MALRRLFLLIPGLVVVLGSLVGTPLQAQDRGAPRFGSVSADDTVEAEASDSGRLWSLTALPFDRFDRRYGVQADSAWAAHLRRGLLRLGPCTAAFVSADGLALTSAECLRMHQRDVSDSEAIVVERPAEEPRLLGIPARRFVSAADVTAQVEAAQHEAAVQEAAASVQRRLQAKAEQNRRVEVIADAGGSYTAYTYRRFEEVRGAFLPSRPVSDFGGIDAAMTYPRQVLDAALVRVYTPDGSPLSVNHFFEVPTQEVRPGDPVFAVGHPRTPKRAETAKQLAVRRDFVLPNQRDLLRTWTRTTRAYLDTAEGTNSQWSTVLRAGERAQKRIQVRLEALQDEYFWARLQRRDAQLREALQRDSLLKRQFGGLLDSLAGIQEAKRSLASAHRAFGTFGAEAYGSSTYHRLLKAVRGDTTREGTFDAEFRLAPQTVKAPRRPVSAETALLADRLRRVQEHLRPDSAAVRRLLQGQTPDERAAFFVETSVLASRDYEPEEGQIVPPDDPMAAVVEEVAPRARSFYEEWTRLARAEQLLTRRLARARQAVHPMPIRLSGLGAPRVTDGRVLGYPSNGTTVPPFTTFYGLYARSHAFAESGPWALPDRWRRPGAEMDRSGPINLAASTDPAVGTEGAPLLNKYLEIVGVTVGTNIQGGAGTYLFLPERMRTVAVDIRGLRQSLRVIYEAEELADELVGGSSNLLDQSR